MLRSIKSFEEYLVTASNGEVGSVTDFLFDDMEWAIRYLIVDTWKLFSGGKVLLSPVAMQSGTDRPESFSVAMTKEEISNSPSYRIGEPISREYEAELTSYYGWPAYWEGFKVGTTGAVNVLSEVLPDGVEALNPARKEISNLWSAREVIGYFIEATDGEIGYVEDFIVDDKSWTIRYMVIALQSWLSDKKVLAFSRQPHKPRRKVLIVPQWTRRISWGEAKVELSLSREAIENSPEFFPHAPVNRLYETRFYDYYGKPAH